MKKGDGGRMPGRLERRIVADFGTIPAFEAAFKQACVEQFGSGGAWLVFDGERLAITKTGNVDTPLTQRPQALLTCDVWEHAYYIDYQNLRPKYVEAFLEHLVDWEAVDNRLELTALA